MKQFILLVWWTHPKSVVSTMMSTLLLWRRQGPILIIGDYCMQNHIPSSLRILGVPILCTSETDFSVWAKAHNIPRSCSRYLGHSWYRHGQQSHWDKASRRRRINLQEGIPTTNKTKQKNNTSKVNWHFTHASFHTTKTYLRSIKQ